MTQNPMLSGDRFRLGTFSSNCSSGMTPTKIAERWDNSWDNNLTLAKMLDEAGTPIDCAPHAQQKFSAASDKPLLQFSLLRRKVVKE